MSRSSQTQFAFPKKRKRKKERGPIPYVISLELTFLPDGLDDWSYEEKVREVVRKRMPDILEERKVKLAWDGSEGNEEFLLEEYDDFVSEIIEEEIACN